jgi:dTDP-4-dehydrorhamnose reductase
LSGLLITGGSGQLAAALAALAKLHGLEANLAGRPDFDFDRPDTIDATFAAVQPTIVLNAAAYTAVDRAEAEPDAAYAANATGPARLAQLCAASGARLVHVSTDYVFDGAKPTPYIESDLTAPAGVYGASKLAGEQAVFASLPDAVVLRTAWVYGATGKNFLRTMLNAARRNTTLKVVADQYGCPTLAADLADIILRLATRPTWQGGLFHACGSGQTSWHGFAAAILDRAALHGLPRPHIEPIATADWPTPAKRPENSRLDCSLLSQTFGLALPDWRESTDRTVDALMTTGLGPLP